LGIPDVDGTETAEWAAEAAAEAPEAADDTDADDTDADGTDADGPTAGVTWGTARASPTPNRVAASAKPRALPRFE
jgi:hypothetical protein